jgi:transposase
MDAQARIEELQAQLVAKDARIAELEQLVAMLREQVATRSKQVELLTEKLRRNSSNSHLPPSSDPPGRQGSSRRQSPNKRPGGRKRGGQPGHQGAHRALVPADQVAELANLYPQKCETCWASLPEIEDPGAERHQVIEVPPLRPHTTEFRRHAVTCTRCGHKTRAPYDESIPSESADENRRGVEDERASQ